MLVTVVLATTLAAPARAVDETPRQGWVPNARVFAVASDGDRVYIGGRFTRLIDPVTGERVERAHVAAFDAATGELVRDWSPSFSGDSRPAVRALAVSDDGTVYVGGRFNAVNGTPARGAAAVQPSGELVPGWHVMTNSTVRALVLHGGGLFLGGVFTRVNGERKVGLARVDAATGTVTTSWQADTDGKLVATLAASSNGSDLVVGGRFNSIAGLPRDFLGSVRFADGTVTDWRPPALCSTCALYDVTSKNGSTYAAIGGPGGRLAAYSDSTGQTRWTRGADGDVQAVAVRGDIVYVGGHFGPGFGGAERHQLAAVYAADGRLTDFAPHLVPPGEAVPGEEFPGVWDMVVDNGLLRVGGGFVAVGDVPQGRYAEFLLPDPSTTATLRLTAMIQGAGSVQSVEGGPYVCSRDANSDDRVTVACATSVHEAPVEATTWLRATPASAPAGHWRFVLWEGCDETRPGPRGTECGLRAGPLDATERRPKAVFDDSVAPTVTDLRVTQAPDAERTFSFSFGSNENGTFECRFGSEVSYQPCVPDVSRGFVGEGTYPMSVRAVDASGNIGVAQGTTVTAVDTRITTGPNRLTSNDAATFAYTSGAGAAFQCRWDSQPWQACGTGRSGSATQTGLAPGVHTFAVKAGNGVWQDRLPASRTWTVDTIDPEVGLTPSTNAHAGTASFGLSVVGGTLSCQLTGPSKAHDLSPCSSFATYTGLTDGEYTFTVQAQDAAGNVTREAHRWTIDRAAPRTRITAGPASGGFLLRTRVRIRYASTEGGSSYRCTLNRVRHRCRGESVLLRGLRLRTHRFRVAATDTAGNRDRSPAVRTWTVPRNNRALRHHRGWTRRSGRGYYLGTYSQTTRRGATLTERVRNVRELALVATSSPRHGTVRVYLGSRLLRRVSLRARSTRKRRLIPIASFDRRRSGRIRIVVASRGRTVRVEGLGVSTR